MYTASRLAVADRLPRFVWLPSELVLDTSHNGDELLSTTGMTVGTKVHRRSTSIHYGTQY